MKNSLIAIAAGAALSALTSSAFAITTVDFEGTFATPTVTNVTNGDTAPTVVLNGLQNTAYFQVDNLVQGGAAADAVNDAGGLLFTVDPASPCINSGCGTGTETANINVTFTFYTAGGATIGTVSDTALATFNYFASPNSGNDNDNLCWQNSAVSGSVVYASQLVNGPCATPAPGKADQTNTYEQIEVNLGGSYYDVNLYDWNDWNEMPSITFQSVSAPARVPEPGSLALLAAGLLGLGFVVARRRRVETGVV